MKTRDKYLTEKIDYSKVGKEDRSQDPEILKLCNTLSGMGETLRTMIMHGNMKDAKMVFKNLKKVVNDLGKSMK